MNDYMGDNGIFDSSTQPTHSQEFIHGFTASFVGALIGAALDNTRFGRWFNTSPVIGWIYRKIGQTVIICVILFAIMYLYELIKIW